MDMNWSVLVVGMMVVSGFVWVVASMVTLALFDPATPREAAKLVLKTGAYVLGAVTAMVIVIGVWPISVATLVVYVTISLIKDEWSPKKWRKK